MPSGNVYLCTVVVPTWRMNPLRSKALSFELYSSMNSSLASVFGEAGLGNTSEICGADSPISSEGIEDSDAELAIKV